MFTTVWRNWIKGTHGTSTVFRRWLSRKSAAKHGSYPGRSLLARPMIELLENRELLDAKSSAFVPNVWYETLNPATSFALTSSNGATTMAARDGLRVLYGSSLATATEYFRTDPGQAEIRISNAGSVDVIASSYVSTLGPTGGKGDQGTVFARESTAAERVRIQGLEKALPGGIASAAVQIVDANVNAGGRNASALATSVGALTVNEIRIDGSPASPDKELHLGGALALPGLSGATITATVTNGGGLRVRLLSSNAAVGPGTQKFVLGTGEYGVQGSFALNGVTFKPFDMQATFNVTEGQVTVKGGAIVRMNGNEQSVTFSATDKADPTRKVGTIVIKGNTLEDAEFSFITSQSFTDGTTFKPGSLLGVSRNNRIELEGTFPLQLGGETQALPITTNSWTLGADGKVAGVGNYVGKPVEVDPNGNPTPTVFTLSETTFQSEAPLTVTLTGSGSTRSFRVQGTPTARFNGGTMDVGMDLTIANPATDVFNLTSQSFTVKNINLGGSVFLPKSLSMTWNRPVSRFTVQGDATLEAYKQTTVTFSPSAFVIDKGVLAPVAFTLPVSERPNANSQLRLEGNKADALYDYSKTGPAIVVKGNGTWFGLSFEQSTGGSFALKETQSTVNYRFAITDGIVDRKIMVDLSSSFLMNGWNFPIGLGGEYDRKDGAFRLDRGSGRVRLSNDDYVDVTLNSDLAPEEQAGLLNQETTYIQLSGDVVVTQMQLGGTTFKGKLHATTVAGNWWLRSGSGISTTVQGKTIPLKADPDPDFPNATNVGAVFTANNLKSFKFDVTNSFELGGITISPNNVGTLANGVLRNPETGTTVPITFSGDFSKLSVRYDASGQTFQMQGGASMLIQGIAVPALLGPAGATATTIPTAFAKWYSTDANQKGLEFVGGSLRSFNFRVLRLDVAGVSLQGAGWGFEGSYNRSTIKPEYVFQGVGILSPTNALVNLVTPSGGPGLLYTFGKLNQLFFRAGKPDPDSVGGVNFPFNSLSATTNVTTSTITFTGQGTTATGQPIDVGPNLPTGVAIKKGEMALVGLLPAEVFVAGVAIPTKGLIQSTNAQGDTVLKSPVGVALGFGIGNAVLSLEVGASGTTGLVLRNNKVVQFGATVRGSFTLNGVAFSGNLTTIYVAATDELKIFGGGTLKFSVPSGPVSLTIGLGSAQDPGLVVRQKNIEQVVASVTSSFTLFGINVGIRDLTAKYVRERAEFGLSGKVLLSTSKGRGQDGGIFKDFEVQLGTGSDAPGIRIVEGRLTLLDVAISGEFKLFGARILPRELRLRYEASNQVLQFTGTVEFALAGKFHGEVGLPGDGLTINTSTGEVQVKGLLARVKDTTFGVLTIKNLEFEYLVDDAAGTTTIRGAGEVDLPGGIGLQGSFEVVGERLASIGIGFEKSPGIAVANGVVFITRIEGSITGLDDPANFSVNASITATVGPSVKIFGQTHSLAQVTGTVFINKEMLKLSGNVELVGGLFGRGSATATLFFSGPSLLKLEASIRLYPGDVIRGTLVLDIDRTGNVTFRGSVGVYIPKGIKRIGGKELGTLTVYLQIRPEERRENSYVSFQAKVLKILDVKATVDFTGRIYGYVDPPIFSKINFSFHLPGTKTLDEFLIEEDASNADANAPIPTLSIVSATPTSGTPAAQIVWQGTSAMPEQTTVDLYADAQPNGYHGRLIAANLPFKSGPQTFVWQDLAAFGALPHSAAQPLYVYGIIKDGSNEPVFTDYSAAVMPPNYDPSVVLPPTQVFDARHSLVFSAAHGSALIITDPLQQALPESNLEVFVDVRAGTLLLATIPGNVTVAGNGTGRLDLVGGATAITAALEGLTYVPLPETAFDDRLTITIGRSPAETMSHLTVGLDLKVRPLVLVLLLPAESVPTYQQSSGPTPLLTDLLIDDGANNDVVDATIAIQNYAPGFDSLQYTPPLRSPIRGDFNAYTGVLRLSGNGTVGQYQQALHSVQFSSTGRGTKALTIEVGNDRGHRASLTVPITIEAIYQAPIVRLDNQGAVFTPQNGEVVLTPQVHIEASDSKEVVAAYVEIGYFTYHPGEDVLHFANTDKITGEFHTETGSLILSGGASAAEYEQAIRSVTYTNSAGTITSGLRDVLVTVLDDLEYAGMAMHRLLVADSTPVLQGPALSLPPDAIQVPSDSESLMLAPELTLADLDVPTLFGATVTIRDGYVPGEDVLSVTDLPATVLASFDAVHGVLYLVGEATAPEYELALRSVAYTNTSVERSSTPRTVLFAALDGLTPGTAALLTLHVPAPPVINTGMRAVNYQDGQTSLPLAPELKVGYRGGPTLDQATVAFTFNYLPDEDRLDFTSQHGITGVFDVNSGVLTLTGVASAQDYQDALRSVRYRNLRVNPGSGFREISFTAQNAADRSLADHVTLDVNPALAGPTLQLGSNSQPVFVEHGLPVRVVPDFRITDPDSAMPEGNRAPTLSGAIVRIRNYVPGEDVLAATPPEGIIASFDGDHGVLFLSGAASLVAYEAAIRSVTYENLSEAPRTVSREIVIELNGSFSAFADSEIATALAVTSLLNPPHRVDGSVHNLTVLQNAPATSLGLDQLSYAPPSDRVTTLVFTVTQLPDAAVGQILLSDGAPVMVNQTYTLEQIRGLSFTPALDARDGAGTFSFTIQAVDPIKNELDPAVLRETVQLTIVGSVTSTQTEAFVAQVYRDLLGRNPEAAGLNWWTRLLEGGIGREEIAQGILGSVEYRTRQISAWYQDFLGRAPEPGGLTFFLDFLAQGHTEEEVKAWILGSPEYAATQTTGDVDSLVRQLYRAILARDPEPAGLAYWKAQLAQSGAISVAKGILQSLEAMRIAANRAFRQFLRHPGENLQLQEQQVFFQARGMLAGTAGLLASDEYFRRYAPASREVPPAEEDPEFAAEFETVDQEFGVATPTEDFSFVGAISTVRGGLGGGTLIAPTWILTAAHLVEGRNPWDLFITLGGIDYQPARIVLHPDYDSSRIGADEANDIALIELSQPVVGVTPSPLFRGTPRVGDVLTLVGEGPRPDSTGSVSRFGSKHTGKTPIDGVSDRLITWNFDDFSEISTVQGDSGCPGLLLRGQVAYVASVASGGTNVDGSFGDQAWNTRVDAYLDWIDGIAGTVATSMPTVDPEQDYIHRLYRDLLGREVDADGLQHWVKFLDAGVSRAEVAAGIAGSTEYQSRFVRDLYKTLLDRPADESGLAHFMNYLGQGHTLDDVTAFVLGSPEYRQRHGDQDPALVKGLDTDVLGSVLDMPGRDVLQRRLAAGVPAEDLALELVLGATARRRLVDQLYERLLGRVAEPGELARQTDALRSGTPISTIVAGLVATDEYESRS